MTTNTTNTKYTMESFDFSVKMLLPTIAEAMDKGHHFPRPELCKMIAVQYFLLSEEDLMRLSYEDRVYYDVVKFAYVCLNTEVQFNWGTQVLNWLNPTADKV